ncbi:hypothetical protein M436DRAFT_86036 [Aureobasidium namibiae CBS 147.97]|uniref:F-box domain-containing protein n=1 Tax=Aureobasidium namibiae CBS 147.97 TaxID=1043004 RepID=A0A074W7L9_9PEZI
MPPKKKNKAAPKATAKTIKGNKTKTNKHSTPMSAHDKTFPFLELPLEVRRMIYRHALASPELGIGQRRALRYDSTLLRYNRFALVDFTVNHFSLFATSKQIRSEIQESGAMSELSFKITSTIALEGFLGYRSGYPGEARDKIDDRILFMLQKAKSIKICIENRRNDWDAPMRTVGWLGATLEDPTTVKLIDSAGKEEIPNGVFQDAVTRWQAFAQTLLTRAS